MSKQIYRCDPCNYEHEHLFFDTVPKSMQQPVPPCPICGKALTHEEQEVVDEQFYRCWASEGGCGAEIDKMLPKNKVTETIPCPNCGKAAKLGVRPGSFGIVHGKTMTKGASIDVAIGRNAEQRWDKLHKRKEVRDKFRKETGSQAISLSENNGNVYATPIKGGKLTTVTVPDSKVNSSEKV